MLRLFNITHIKIFSLLTVYLIIGVIFCNFINIAIGANNATTSVVITVCGNGIVEAGEECDDGNVISGDGCCSSCQTEAAVCGNGTIESGEECDDGNTTSGDGCSASCQTETTTSSGGGGGIYVAPVITKVIIQGRAYPNTIVTILKDGSVATDVRTDSQANFKAEISDITAGVYTFGLWAEDINGAKSIVFNFTTSVAANTITTVSGIFLPPTISLNSTVITQGDILSILGQTAPESEISIYINSAEEIIKETKSDDIGVWFYNFKTDILEQGSHTTRAKAVSTDGLLSTFSQTLSFNVGEAGVEETGIKTDLNHDDKINLIDFSIMLYWWGKDNERADQNKNGIVDLADFSIMMYYWTG